MRVKKGAPLTAKQQAFVDEYLKDMNATKAYIRAGYAGATAKVNAAKMIAGERVRSAIAAAIEERAKATKIDANWMLTRLAEEVDADLADILNDDGSIKDVRNWPKVWRTGLVQSLDIESIGDAVRVAKVRLSDRAKRLELIGRHVDVQAWNDKVEVNLPEVIRKDWRGKTG